MRAVEEPTWDFVRERLEWLMADPASVNDDLVATRQAIYAQPGMIESMRATLALQDMDTRVRNLISDDDLKRIDVPTLVLWTSHDPRRRQKKVVVLPGSSPRREFALMEDCGHWPQFEKPEEFNRIHQEFLR